MPRPMVGESYQATFRWHPVCILRGSFKKTRKVISIDVGYGPGECHDEIGQMSVSVGGSAFVKVLLLRSFQPGF